MSLLNKRKEEPEVDAAGEPVVEDPNQYRPGKKVTFVLKQQFAVGDESRDAGSIVGEVTVDENVTTNWLADAIRMGRVMSKDAYDDMMV